MAETFPKGTKTDHSGDLPGHIKSEVVAAAVKSEEGDNELVPVTVEFNFCSCETELLKKGQMTGTLQVPMLQDPRTGRFRIPSGTTQAEGNAKFTYIRFRDRNEWNFENRFTATFERTNADSPIDNFKLGYRLSGEQEESGFHTSLCNSEDVYDRNRDGDFSSEFQTYPIDREGHVDRNLYQTRLNDWEANAGGMLTVFAKAEIDDTFLENLGEEQKEEYEEDTVWKANYKIKLYTTLSAHSANETNNLKVEDEAVPQWDRLEQLMIARFPDRGASWAKRAVKNYIYFLEMKKEHNDWNSEIFSPSKWIDEVWHAHLSFTDRYQHDMMAFCGNIIEHSPVLGMMALFQYHVGCNKHYARMRRLNELVDSEFWPPAKGEKQRIQSRQPHDGDSDDACYLPNHSSCG